MPNDIEERGYEENSQIFTSRRLFQYFDRQADTVAVCNAHGTIKFVNDEWWRFASNNGYDGPDFVGQSYFALCAQIEGAERRHAEDVLAGLTQLRAGDIGTFSYIYPCHIPTEERWFRLLATFERGEFHLQHQRVMLRLEEAGTVTPAAEREAALHRDTQIAQDIRTYVNGVLGYLEVSRHKRMREKNVETASLLLAEAEHVGWRVHNALHGRRHDDAAVHDHLEPAAYSADVGDTLRRGLARMRLQYPGVSTDCVVATPRTVRLLARQCDVEDLLTPLLTQSFADAAAAPGTGVVARLEINGSGGFDLTVATDPPLDPETMDPDAIPDEVAHALGASVDADGCGTVRVAFPAWRSVDLTGSVAD